MGCDIHVLTEIRYPGEKWKLWLQRPYIQYPDEEGFHPHANDEIDCISARDYCFFGILAGVRSYYGRPIAEARGVPRDASDEIKLWGDKNEYHSLTWCTLSEMERAIKRYNRETLKESLESQYILSDRFIKGLNVEPFSTTVYVTQNENTRSIYSKYADFPTITARPVRDQYEMIKGEREFLGLGKPRVRFIIGFDS